MVIELIGKRIKEIRKKKRLSQTGLAEKLDTQQASIWRWETGRNLPDVYNLIKLAKELDVSLDYIVGIKDENIQ